MIAILLPAHNEAEAIGKVIGEVSMAMGSLRHRIVVVDSGSTDSTAQEAKKHGVTVLPAERGKGKAVRYGANYLALNEQYEAVVMMNSDYTYPAQHIPAMLEALGKHDAVYGIRDYSVISPVHRFGNEVLSTLATVLWNVPIFDLCSGMWAFRREALAGILPRLCSDGFTLEADIYTALLAGRCSIGCIPIGYRPRIGNAKLHMGDGFRIAAFLLRRRLTGR